MVKELGEEMRLGGALVRERPGYQVGLERPLGGAPWLFGALSEVIVEAHPGERGTVFGEGPDRSVLVPGTTFGVLRNGEGTWLWDAERRGFHGIAERTPKELEFNEIERRRVTGPDLVIRRESLLR